jgi:hypothetical protein
VPGVDLKKNLIGYILVGVAMLIIWFFMALMPHYRQYNQTKLQINEAQLKLIDYQETIRMLPEYVKTQNELARKKAELTSSLYTKENILNLFEKLYLIADKQKVSIVEITPPIEELLQINRIVPDSLGLLFLNISLRIEGDFRDFGRFVSKLEEETFYRGPNNCSVIGTNDPRFDIQYVIGFKSLLGSLKEGA